MILYAKSHCISDAVTTDDIIAPQWHNGDPAILAAYCLASRYPVITELVREGDALLAGHAFGTGPDPEPAVLALQAAGFALIICESAEPAFVAVAHAYGLPVLVCPDVVAHIQPGALLRVDLEAGTIIDRSNAIMYPTPACPPDLLATVRRLHLLNRMRRVVEDEEYDG